MTVIEALKGIDRRVFALLLVAGLLGFLAVLPYVFDLIENGAFGQAAKPSIPLPLVIGLALVQNGILLAVAIAAGMILSERIGLRMPLIQAWAKGDPQPGLGQTMLPGLLVGMTVGAILIACELLFFLRHLPQGMLSAFEVPLWKRMLGGVIYGGITEELLMRLFLLSLVAWLLGKSLKTSNGIPSPGAFWLAIVIVAIAFALGHLPATAAITPITQLLVVRTLVLNGIAGIAFGYLYWRHGLEAAVSGHMGAHLIMQGPGVMLLKDFM